MLLRHVRTNMTQLWSSSYLSQGGCRVFSYSMPEEQEHAGTCSSSPPASSVTCQWLSEPGLACKTATDAAGNLFLFDDTFEDNEATNGAAVYAEQGCGEVPAFPRLSCMPPLWCIKHHCAPMCSHGACLRAHRSSNSTTTPCTALQRHTRLLVAQPSC